MEEGAAKRLRVLSTITERPFKRLKTEEEPPLTEDDAPDPSEWSDTAGNESESYKADIPSKEQALSDKKPLTSSLNEIEDPGEDKARLESEDSGDDYNPTLKRKPRAKKGKGSVAASKPWHLQKEKYRAILHCTDSDIEGALAALGLPCHFHKLSRSNTKDDDPEVAKQQKKGESISSTYHSASTVTPEIMAKRGWHFRSIVGSKQQTDAPIREPKKPKITFEEIYRPMSGVRGNIPLTSSPIRLEGQGSEDDIQQIPRALRLVKVVFNDQSTVFTIPREWLEESCGDLGLQPCLPRRFEVGIRRKREMKGFEDELQTPGPSFASTQSVPGTVKKEKVTIQSPGNEELTEGAFDLVIQPSLTLQTTNHGALPRVSVPSTPKLVKKSIDMGSNFSLLSPYQFKTPMGLPTRGSPRSPLHLTSPSPYPKTSGQAEESDDSGRLTIENLKQHNFHADTARSPTKIAQTPLPHVISPPENPVVEELVKQLGLEENGKSPTLESALELQRALLPLQLEYDKKKYKKRICEQAGIPKSAESAVKADQSAGTSLWTNVVYESREVIVDLDRSRRTGNTTLNENANDINGTEMKVIWKWAEFDGSTLIDPSEGAVEKEVGGLLHGIFFSQTGELKQIENEEMEIAYPLRLFGTNPHPDFAVRLQGENWNHWGFLAPCVFSAECKREDTISAKSEAQLAMNSHAILNILVIMYLDMRITQFDPMPAWMWVFGILYTERGFSIYCHYSRVIKSDKTENGFIWEFQSCRLTDEFMNVYVYGQTTVNRRMRALATLWRIRSHTNFVIEQIRQWATTHGQYVGGEGPIDKFIIMAQLERRNIDWLEARIKEMKAARKDQAQKDPSAKAIKEKQTAEGLMMGMTK